MKIFGVGENKKENINEFEIRTNDFEEYKEDKGQIALDIIEDENEFMIISPIAGVDLEDIDISLNDGILIISGNRKKPMDLYLNGSILRVSELFWGNFSRTIILPENLDLDNIKAILEKNILIVKILKLKFKGQSINIEKIDY